jgi:methyl-accepting chemotaxis protein
VPGEWRDFPRSLKIGASLIFLAALGLTGLQMYQAVARGSELSESRELVVHTFQVIRAAQHLERAVQDAERGQRGYLLTNDRKYLTPYEEGSGQIPALEDELRRMISDNVEQKPRLLILHRQIDAKLAELKSTIDANDTQGFAAAKAIVITDVGLQAMRDITGLIDTIINAEDALLTQRMDRAAQSECYQRREVDGETAI